MNKIPVGKVLSETFNFSFQKYVSLVGVLWLPMVISLLFTWFVMFPHMLADAAAGGLRPAGSPLAIFAMEFVFFVLMAVMSVGVTKEALGLREGPRFVYLSVGAAELRVLGGYLLLGLITVVLGIALAAIIAILVAILGGVSSMKAIAPAIVLFGVVLPMIYFWIRLSSFQSVVSVVEHRFGLWRSWTLTRGNFWRLIAIVMAIWIPIIILSAITLSLTMGPAFTKVIAAVPSGAEAVRSAQREMLVSMLSFQKYATLVFLPFAPIVYGLMIAPAAFAYRELVPSSATDAAAGAA